MPAWVRPRSIHVDPVLMSPRWAGERWLSLAGLRGRQRWTGSMSGPAT